MSHTSGFDVSFVDGSQKELPYICFLQFDPDIYVFIIITPLFYMTLIVSFSVSFMSTGSIEYQTGISWDQRRKRKTEDAVELQCMFG